MKKTVYLLWSAGFVLLVGLIIHQGAADVVKALAAASWGVVLVIAYRLIPMAAETVSWRILLPHYHRRPFTELLWMRWIGDAINTLMPVAQVGGELVRARLLNKAGTPGAWAGASIVVDITTGVLTQMIFALCGVGLLLYLGIGGDAVQGITIGIGLFTLLIFGFYLAQRSGMFLSLSRVLEWIAGDQDWLSQLTSAAELDRTVTRLYRRRGRFIKACLWRLLAWTLGAGEVWLALYFLGNPVSPAEAIMFESLGNAIRSTAFLIPGALGIQEGGFILLGSFIGLSAETALALSLIKRVRELVLGLPGLLSWQIPEGKRFFKRATESV
ncbi:flippase-like domain-containing protein [Methylomonas sp. MgM2]